MVYGLASKEEASKLWLKEPGEGPWLSPAPGQLLLWAGEAFAEAPAVEHCVRMRPLGGYVEHSHSRRDPEAPETGNRRSVALVGSRVENETPWSWWSCGLRSWMSDCKPKMEPHKASHESTLLSNL